MCSKVTSWARLTSSTVTNNARQYRAHYKDSNQFTITVCAPTSFTEMNFFAQYDVFKIRINMEVKINGDAVIQLNNVERIQIP